MASEIAGGDLTTLLEFLRGRPLDDREARNVIARLLLIQPSCAEREVAARLVATLFQDQAWPGWTPVWTVDFKRADGGQSNPWFESAVAQLVHTYRAKGNTYHKSIGLVAEMANLTERRVQQIWAKYKNEFPFNPRAPEPYANNSYQVRSSEVR